MGNGPMFLVLPAFFKHLHQMEWDMLPFSQQELHLKLSASFASATICLYSKAPGQEVEELDSELRHAGSDLRKDVRHVCQELLCL
jgi:hypothetical protein